MPQITLVETHAGQLASLHQDGADLCPARCLLPLLCRLDREPNEVFIKFRRHAFLGCCSWAELGERPTDSLADEPAISASLPGVHVHLSARFEDGRIAPDSLTGHTHGDLDRIGGGRIGGMGK